MLGMKTSTIIRSKVALSSAARPLAPPTAIATRTTVLRQPGPNGQADMRVVVDNQNTTHNGLLAARVPALGFDALISCRESVRKSHFGRKCGRRLPRTGYWNLWPSAELQNCNVKLIFARQQTSQGQGLKRDRLSSRLFGRRIDVVRAAATQPSVAGSACRGVRRAASAPQDRRNDQRNRPGRSGLRTHADLPAA